jgi:hypothetical protein
VSRSDTHDAAPLWHGPALRAAFVAQLLGQVMPQQGVQSGLSGYEPRRERVLSLGFDARA